MIEDRRSGRGMVVELPGLRTTHLERDALQANPAGVYYQLVTVSCGGDLESPY